MSERVVWVSERRMECVTTRGDCLKEWNGCGVHGGYEGRRQREWEDVKRKGERRSGVDVERK